MRIQYSSSISVLLSLLMTVSACQGNAHRMYMDASDKSATSQPAQEQDASAMSLQVITDTTLPGAYLKDASVQTSSASNSDTSSPSSSDGGSSMSVQVSPVQGSEAPEDAKSNEVIAQEATDKQAAPQYPSEDHENWFYEFVDAVNNAEKWDEITSVLDKGKPLGYLTQSIAWDDDEYTPLHYAAQEGELDVVRELVDKHGVSVDILASAYKRTPLHLAALRGRLAVVKYLVDRKAGLETVDKDGSDPLHYAALGSEGEANTEVIKYLHERGADLSKVSGKINLLYLAIRVGNASLADYLLANCPQLINQNGSGMAPLAYAQARQETNIAQAIQDKMGK